MINLKSTDAFQDRHIGPDTHETKDMLAVIGVKSVDELISQTISVGNVGNVGNVGTVGTGAAACCGGFSMKATCRQVCASRALVLSYDSPVSVPISLGRPFHSLHATSHALHPMQTLVSVKNP